MLLDAALSELCRVGWRQVTMAHIANLTGVGRAKVYTEFGGRDGLARALVEREVERLDEAVADALSRHAAHPHDALTAALDAFLFAPFVAVVLRGDAGQLVAAYGDPDQLARTAEVRLRPTLRATWPGLGVEQAELLTAALVRIAASFALAPGCSEAASAVAAGAVLGAYVERAPASAGASA